MLSTPWSTELGLRVPIVNAPMGGFAGGRLAAAIIAAGGLGMVGMGSVATRASLQTQLQHVHQAFGTGLVDWVMRNEAGLPADALAARPVLLSVSFDTDWSWVARLTTPESPPQHRYTTVSGSVERSTQESTSWSHAGPRAAGMVT